MTSPTYTGPLSFAVFAVASGAPLAAAFQELEALRERHAIEVLDVELLTRGEDGAVRREAFDDAAVAATETDLLDDEDLAVVAAELEEGERALVVLYEDRSLASVADLLAASGGREIWVGGLDVDALDAEDGTAQEETA